MGNRESCHSKLNNEYVVFVMSGIWLFAFRDKTVGAVMLVRVPRQGICIPSQVG
jgi:hypothetical protein